MHELRHVEGVPKLMGLCPKPPALLITYHGNRTLADWLKVKAPAKLVLHILYSLVGVLERLHAAGFSHNDVKSDNVMASLQANGSVTVTLIDLGGGCRLGQRPFPGLHNITISAAKHAYLMEVRAARHQHIAPEVFLGGVATP